MLNIVLLESILCKCRIGNMTIFQGVLQILCAEVSNNPNMIDEAWSQIPKDLRPTVSKKIATIKDYFNDGRYPMLTMEAAIWGIVINAIRVACEVKIPERQKEMCGFAKSDIVQFFQDLSNHWNLRKAVYDACNLAVPDFQMLRALMTCDTISIEKLKVVVQHICEEGPTGEKKMPPEVAAIINPNRFDGGTYGNFQNHEET